MSRALRHKLLRDVWRERWRFTAIAAVVAIGVAVFVAATESYRNLDQSFDSAYAAQRLPDAIISGTGVAGLRGAVATMPGKPLVDVRHQADVGIRVNGHAVFGRAVGVPDSGQPSVSMLDLQAGTLPHVGQVVIEQHVADHYHVRPEDTVELLGGQGWQSFTVSGAALSAEYLWPARSSQEILTTPEDFAVVYLADDELQRLLPDRSEQIAVYARDRSAAGALITACGELARKAGLSFVPRDQQPSYFTLHTDVVQFGSLARLLPFLFLAAVVLGSYVLLARIVSAQRAVIGTLMANGLSAGTVRRHYLGYGLACAAVGIPPGLFGGYVLGRWITAKYAQAIALPLQLASTHPLTYVLAAGAAVSATLLAAVAPATAAARMRPADAMRVTPPPGRDRRRVIGLTVGQRIPARWRMTLRAVLRNRRRTVFTTIGVAVSVILVMVFAGMRDTVPGMVHRQFGQIEHQDGQVVVFGSADSIVDRLRADPDVVAVEPYSAYGVTVSAGAHRYDTQLIALASQPRLHSFRAQSGPNRLPDHGVLLGVGLRDLLSVSLGDRVDVVMPQSGLRLTERVAGFVDEPFSPVVYISMSRLRAQAGPLPANGVLVKLDPRIEQRAVGDRIAALPGVVAYRSTTALAATMRKTFSLYGTLVDVMLVFAAVMAAALLYNAMSANIAERLGELGALHAEGMGVGMLARLIAAENFGLAVVAVPFGVLGGIFLADRLLSTYQTHGYHMRLEMQPTTPVLVAVAILVAAALAQIPVLHKVRGIDVARLARERSV
ncbi:ABC transporter permease [Mycobacterium sp.]|uniref:ABC transporter permease n=1 Tax=Mycobacterium sp. TaxID=1785 RepID=UPI00126C43A5|nr:ABC transporter permease [Mycobacterium sp.]KAA8965440.1 MAG: FtsX-like permease family protein [Mycobacterium sp.]